MSGVTDRSVVKTKGSDPFVVCSRTPRAVELVSGSVTKPRAAFSNGEGVSQPVAVVSTETINDAKAGSRNALEEIFRVYQPGLIRYLHTRAPGLAEDVASQTWISVAKSISNFHGDGSALRGWILTIGHRRLTDEFRRQERRLDHAAELIDITDNATPEDIVTESAGWAKRLLSQLPPQQADVVMMRVIGGLSVQEVADATGLSRANVRVLSHRGLARLQVLLTTDSELAGIPGLRREL